ncbi:MAG: hypothetical protein K0S80_3561 [Neobacillus sp.]|nr:hypothetical protein [Neobacillus sp.]
MLQGICIDPGYTAALQKGTSYYLFPNGTKHFYVSKFPNRNAHKGCFQTKYFQIIEKEAWPEEPKVSFPALDAEKIYKANLIWRNPGYTTTLHRQYFLKPSKTHTFFFRDYECKDLAGCFPLHWFSDFEELILDIIDQEIPDFDIEFEESDQFFVESEPSLAKFEQLSLFDF